MVIFDQCGTKSLLSQYEYCEFRRVFKSFFKPFLTTREKGDAGRSQKSTSILQYHSNSEKVEMVQNVDGIEPSNRTILV